MHRVRLLRMTHVKLIRGLACVYEHHNLLATLPNCLCPFANTPSKLASLTERPF